MLGVARSSSCCWLNAEMRWIFAYLIAMLMPPVASAVEQTPTVIRVVGKVDSIHGSVSTTLESSFDLTLSITGDIDDRGTYESMTANGVLESYADIRFDTDIGLSTGSFQNHWKSQFGALALVKSEVGGNLVFDLGTDINMYIAKQGPFGPPSLDFAGGIEYLLEGDPQDVRMDFLFEPSGTAAFGGRVTKIEVVPEPSLSVMLIGSLFGILIARRRRSRSAAAA